MCEYVGRSGICIFNSYSKWSLRSSAQHKYNKWLRAWAYTSLVNTINGSLSLKSHLQLRSNYRYQYSTLFTFLLPVGSFGYSGCYLLIFPATSSITYFPDKSSSTIVGPGRVEFPYTVSLYCSMLGFLNLGSFDIWGWIALCCGGLSCLLMNVSSILGSTGEMPVAAPQLWEPEMSSGTTRCLLGGKTVPGWGHRRTLTNIIARTKSWWKLLLIYLLWDPESSRVGVLHSVSLCSLYQRIAP